jgi:hypothetical protein
MMIGIGGAMMIGIGAVLFWAISRVQAFASVAYILACAIAVGAAARIYARIVYGDPENAGTIPIFLETTLPVLIVLLQYYVVKEGKESLKWGILKPTRRDMRLGDSQV